MKIRMKISVAGTFHNIEGGVKVGDVVEVDDMSGAGYIEGNYAEAVRSHHAPVVEHAVVPAKEERAVVETEPEPVKRGPGRPRKNT